ncbi:hypothetical protein HC891_10035 [Candidatus Gracilibacteria bacterium]|nr:hypothetical protein [Candidatus Gracilibacteria bacterium]
MEHLSIAKQLDARRGQLAERVTELALQNPFWEARFGAGIRERLILDMDANLAVVAKAVRYRSPMMLDDHILWRRNQVLGFGCTTGHLREMFAYKWLAINEVMPPHTHPEIYQYIEAAMYALSYQHGSAAAVTAVHEELAERIVAVSFDTFWHWQAAYGSDARTVARNDAWFLVDCLTDALAHHDDSLLGRYVRWKRDQLLTSGLSSVHVQHVLWLTAEAADDLLAPGPAADVRRALEHAASFLSHTSEASLALVEAQEQIVGEVAQQLVSIGLAPQPEQAVLEVGWYLAYLNDGIATSDASGLACYTRWMQQFLADQGLPDTPLRQSYHALGNAIMRYLPDYAARDATAILHAAQRVL